VVSIALPVTSRGDEVSSGGENSFVVGLELGIVFVGFVAVVVFGRVEYGDDETFGFDLRRCSGTKSSFHDYLSILVPSRGRSLDL